MLVIIAVLASLPALVGALPVSAKSEAVATLLARLRASEPVAYTGLASSSGQLAVPDLGVGTDVTALLSGGNRLRAWWAGPAHYRVDRLTFAAESDVYRDGDGVWSWDSGKRLAIHTQGTPQIPLPGAPDALPPNLARRLLAQADTRDVRTAGARSIAGRTGLGLVWQPRDPRSLISQVKAWVDQGTGLPLAVEVTAVGGGRRAFSSSFLDLALKAPSPAQLRFDPDRDPTATVENTEPNGPDSTTPAVKLPATIGGLPQRSPAAPLIATYGAGPDLVAVAAIDPLGADALRQQIDSPSRPPIRGSFGQGSLIETPLLTGLVFATNDNGYVLLGSVTRDQIEAMALDLVQHPPGATLATGLVAGRRP
jgi:hypothetical protein